MPGSDAARTLGTLVQVYVQAQCDVIADARDALAARDESAVHPVRVAIRRLRATLRTFGAVYDAEDRKDFARELRWAGLLLGEVRDLQVLAGRLLGEDGPKTAAERVIADEIDRDLDPAWDAVIAALASTRGAELHAAVTRWRVDPPFSDDARRPTGRARKRVTKTQHRLQSRLQRARAAAESDEHDVSSLVHSARKAAKRHRYAVELAAPVLDGGADEMIERGRALQDALGEHQDDVVALAFLQKIDVGQTNSAVETELAEIIRCTGERAGDVAAVIREADRLAG